MPECVICREDREHTEFPKPDAAMVCELCMEMHQFEVEDLKVFHQHQRKMHQDEAAPEEKKVPHTARSMPTALEGKPGIPKGAKKGGDTERLPAVLAPIPQPMASRRNTNAGDTQQLLVADIPLPPSANAGDTQQLLVADIPLPPSANAGDTQQLLVADIPLPPSADAGDTQRLPAVQAPGAEPAPAPQMPSAEATIDNNITCPNSACGGSFEINPWFYDTVAECPNCGLEFIIRPPAEAVEPEKKKKEPKKDASYLSALPADHPARHMGAKKKKKKKPKQDGVRCSSELPPALDMGAMAAKPSITNCPECNQRVLVRPNQGDTPVLCTACKHQFIPASS